jgi:hypothetical protein
VPRDITSSELGRRLRAIGIRKGSKPYRGQAHSIPRVERSLRLAAMFAGAACLVI